MTVRIRQPIQLDLLGYGVGILAGDKQLMLFWESGELV